MAGNKRRNVNVAKQPVVDSSVYAKMQTKQPYKIYKKTILGLVSVNIIDPFTDLPVDVLLKGNPRVKEDLDCYVELWSERELMYFLRTNRVHLSEGVLVPYNKPIYPTRIEKTFDNLPDEEVAALVVAPFKKLENAVKKMRTESAIARTLTFAEEANRPEKTMAFLRERLSMIQRGE